jgi:hypothetical protein
MRLAIAQSWSLAASSTSERVTGMTNVRCTCGFSEAAGVDETIGDHLLEMFAPEDCQGTDGLLHEEVQPDLTCSCGLAAATAEQLDAHFIQIFTPADSIGRDGRNHEQIP